MVAAVTAERLLRTSRFETVSLPNTPLTSGDRRETNLAVVVFGLLRLIVASVVLGGPVSAPPAQIQHLIAAHHRYLATSVRDPAGRRHVRDVSDLWVAFGTETTYVGGSDRKRTSRILVWEAGCNEWTYHVAIGARRLAVSSEGLTMVLCPPAVRREESWLNAFFHAEPRWRIRGDELLLKAGQRQLAFRRDVSGGPR
jgi:hypothetical protein